MDPEQRKQQLLPEEVGEHRVRDVHAERVAAEDVDGRAQPGDAPEQRRRAQQDRTAQRQHHGHQGGEEEGAGAAGEVAVAHPGGRPGEQPGHGRHQAGEAGQGQAGMVTRVPALGQQPARGDAGGEVSDPEGEELVSLPEQERAQRVGDGCRQPDHVERELHRHRRDGQPRGGAEAPRPEQEDRVELRDEEEEVEVAGAAAPPVEDPPAAGVDVPGQEQADGAVDRRPGEEWQQGAPRPAPQEGPGPVGDAGTKAEEQPGEGDEGGDAEA